MKDLTIILPIHKELNEKELIQFDNAYKSASETKVLIVGPKKAISNFELKEGDEFIFNEKKTDFSSQIEKAVDKVKTKFFSVLEFDDVYTPIWFSNVEKYINTDTDSVSVYLPLIEAFEEVSEGRKLLGYINEPVWASSFSSKIGHLDLESLLDYPNFNVTGGIIRTADYKEIGGLKTSIKLSFWFEFLLRLLNKGKIVFVIPKVGYLHCLNREDSLFDQYHKTMSEEEIEWWIDLAKKEYLFKNDRNKVFEAE